MKALDILNYIENNPLGNYFIDLHIVDNQVVGFYKTHSIKYKNTYKEDVSYLFPTTFIFTNNTIEIMVTFGSVERNFIAPNILGEYICRNNNVELVTIPIYPHLYKLLAVKYSSIDKNQDIYFNKELASIISTLEGIGFPFIRITNNNSLFNKEVTNLYGERVNARTI